jgi:ATP-dependent protease ClpP protease subunit
MNGAVPLSQKFPEGCYIGFNAAIDRKAAEQLCLIVADSMRNGYTIINLCISSVGGILDHTYYAFNILEALDVKFITWNTGNIQSASNILFLLGDERYSVDGATFFFHQTGYEPPTSRITEPYLVERLKAVQYDDNRSASIIATKTGRPVEDIRSWQNTELVMDSAAALRHGLIHAVRPLSIPLNAFFYQVIV